MWFGRDKFLVQKSQAVCMVLLFASSACRGGIRGVGAFAPAAFVWRSSRLLLCEQECRRQVHVPTLCHQTRPLQSRLSLRQSVLGLSNYHQNRLSFGFPIAAAAPRTLSHRLFAQTSNDNNDNWHVPKTIHIPEESLDMSFVRSSGAGGQNVNKVNTQVQLRVLIDGMGWIPYEVRERLRQQETKRINKEGFLILQVQEFRTQTQNRKAAITKLREMILRAWPRPKKRQMRKGISEKTKKQRREDKRKRKLVKESRRRVEF